MRGVVCIQPDKRSTTNNNRLNASALPARAYFHRIITPFGNICYIRRQNETKPYLSEKSVKWRRTGIECRKRSIPGGKQLKRIFFLLVVYVSVLPAAFAAPSLCGERPAISYHSVNWLGGTGFTVNVTAPANCTYSISTSSGSNVVVTSPITATGDSTITYNVPQNFSLSSPRVSVIIVGRKTITINQGRADFLGNAKRVQLDFDGDQVSDYIVIENQGGQMVWWRYIFHFNPGVTWSALQFGLWNDDTPVPNDYDGDLKCDIAIWRPGPGPNSQAWFYILRSGGNFVEYIPWGVRDDDPTITQDFDGDFKADPAVARKENGKAVWYVKLSATNTVWVQQFGNASDKPIRGDFDGDYRADLAVYRPNTDTPANTFLYLRSSDDLLGLNTFGLSDIDKVVPTDFDGDAATDISVWRTTTGDWYWMSPNGDAVNAFHWGQPGDLPVPGEYNSTRQTDYVIWRPGTPGVFYTKETDGTPFVPILPWGNSTFMVPGYTMQVR